MHEYPQIPRSRAPGDAAPVDEEQLARTRLRFLTDEAIEPDHVRDAILASWWRSRRLRVPADRIDLPYVGDPALDAPLLQGMEPVLDRLAEQLAGQPISLILTDPTGVVLTQHTGDPDLHRHLESVELVPGFSYGERFVGTNGIGTALEDGRPTHVFGHEHYAENLEMLACAGAPIRHPISGKIVGAVDLTCWRKDAGGLLVALARTTAEQIQQALLTHSDIREVALFQAYLQACRRTTGIVIAYNNDIVMMNDHGRQLLDPADQAVLLGHATEALSDDPRATAVVALPTGTRVRMHCRRVRGYRERDIAGGVVSVQLMEPEDDTAGAAAMVPMFVPGVVGSAPSWLRCCYQVSHHYLDNDWLVLAGEPGVGKHALARGVHQRHNATGRQHSLDAAEVTGATLIADVRRDLLDDPVDTLVIRHVDQVGEDTVPALTALLQEARDNDSARLPWVALTAGPSPELNPDLADLLMLFPHTVQIPPLRRHIDDLNDLIPLFLNTLCRGGQLTCSPPAMHLLMRARWPGNVAQVYRVLRDITRRRRGGAIQPADLPPEFRSATRRSLNRLESTERDLIVQGLEDTGGNKAQAAKLLGMSRATIYRKIHDYGIVIPERPKAAGGRQ